MSRYFQLYCDICNSQVVRDLVSSTVSKTDRGVSLWHFQYQLRETTLVVSHRPSTGPSSLAFVVKVFRRFSDCVQGNSFHHH